MKPLICNLKMNHNFKEITHYKRVVEGLNCSSIALCVPACFLPLMHSKKYKIVAQDVSSFPNGGHTGEVSAEALKSIDVCATLIGHSDLQNSFEVKCAKLKQALKHGLHAYVILSETKEEYDYQYTSMKLLGQIRAYLSQVSQAMYSKITFIYEPSWLVGSDEALDIKDVENILYFMKEELRRDYDITFPFYYGGGLTEKNILPYYQSEYIDGLLLGHLCNDANFIVQFLQSFEVSTKVDKSVHN